MHLMNNIILFICQDEITLICKVIKRPLIFTVKSSGQHIDTFKQGWAVVPRFGCPGPAGQQITGFRDEKLAQSRDGHAVPEFLFLCYSSDICRQLRDCPAGRESGSVPTLFVSRGIGTEVCGTSGTGTNLCGTVPRDKRNREKNRGTVPSLAHGCFPAVFAYLFR